MHKNQTGSIGRIREKRKTRRNGSVFVEQKNLRSKKPWQRHRTSADHAVRRVRLLRGGGGGYQKTPFIEGTHLLGIPDRRRGTMKSCIELERGKGGVSGSGKKRDFVRTRFVEKQGSQRIRENGRCRGSRASIL